MAISERKDKNGNVISYVMRYYHGRNKNGKHNKPITETWKPEKGMTKKQSEKSLALAYAEFELRCKNGNVANPTITLNDFCDDYLNTAYLEETTKAFYKNQIENHIKPIMGHLKLKDIKPTHVQSYIEKLSKKPKVSRSGEVETDERLSTSTVQRYLTVLRSILKTALKRGLITENPANGERLTLPKVQDPKIEFFTRTEAAKILACAEDEPLSFQVMMHLAIFAGGRRGEITALKFSDIDFERQIVTIERAAYKNKGEPVKTKSPKDNDIRSVTVPMLTIELIQKLQIQREQERQQLGTQWMGEDWLFTKMERRNYEPTNTNKAIFQIP